MQTPSRQDFKRFFKGLPGWVLPLILVLLFGRFLLILLFHH